MTRRIISGIILALVIFLVGFGAMKALESREKESPKTPQVTVKRFVETQTVKYAAVTTSITASGRVYSQQLTDVITEVRGKILPGSVALKNGTSFRQGDILFKVYQKDALFSHQANVSNFLNALASVLPDLKIDFPKRYTQWEEFFNNISMDKDLPEIPEPANTKEKIFMASRGIFSNYYSLLAAEEQLKKYTIYAPFNGSFQSVNYEAGSVANPGTPIAKVINTDKLEIEVPVSVDNATWIKPGATVGLLSESNMALGTGTVNRISDFVNEATQTFNVYVRVSGVSGKVYSGQYLKVIFDNIHVPNALEIPRNALFNRNRIFTVDTGYLKIAPVNILKYSSTKAVINGLPEGEIIVIEPLANVKENTAVDYQKGPEND